MQLPSRVVRYQYRSLGSTYHTAPEFRDWYRGRSGVIILAFTKRLQANQPDGIITVGDGNGNRRVLTPGEYDIDGSWIVIRPDAVRDRATPLIVQGMLDDPATRLRPAESPANPMVGTVTVHITGRGGVIPQQ